MERNQRSVNPRRRYDSSRRREQAARTRDAVLEVATRRFLDGGYAETTVASIAADASVSVETVYKTFGGKAGLVRAIWERGLRGSGPVPAEERSDRMQLQERDPRAVIRGWGTLTTEVAPRTAPILLLVRAAAAADPDISDLLREAEDARLRRMEHNARRLFERGDLRPDVGLDGARDVLWTFSSPELYELLVLRRGWPLERYGRFIADAMIGALLPSERPPRPRTAGRKA